jgi:hypothetical protein
VVGYHGIEVTVPRSWKLNKTTCGTPIANTVIRDEGAVPTCAIPRPPGVSSVELQADPSQWLALLRHVRTVTNRYGVRLLEGSVRQRPGLTVVLPAVGVLIFVDTTRRSETTRILDSIRITARDVSGCNMRQRVLEPPAHYRPADPAGLARQLVPPGAGSATLCHYQDNWLVSAAVASGAELAQLTQQANGVPRGYVHASRRDYLPGLCSRPTSAGGERGTGFELTVHYPQRAAVRLWAHIGFCGPLGITNGVRTGRLTERLARAVTLPLHTGFEIPGVLLPGAG